MKETKTYLLPLGNAPVKTPAREESPPEHSTYAVTHAVDMIPPAQEEIVQPKESYKKKLILALVALMLLGGGAVAAVYLGLLPIQRISKSVPTKEPVAVTHPTESGPMVKISSLIINLKEEAGRHYIKTTIVMEIGKKEWSEEINAQIPLLTDLAILTVGDKRLEDMKIPTAKENLKKELLAKMNEALNGQKIKQIYFDEFLYQ
jgi:flagellar protein FliL